MKRTKKKQLPSNGGNGSSYHFEFLRILLKVPRGVLLPLDVFHVFNAGIYVLFMLKGMVWVLPDMTAPEIYHCIKNLLPMPV